jgi:hypothetical protein
LRACMMIDMTRDDDHRRNAIHHLHIHTIRAVDQAHSQ